jgi:D-lyxose ketol-isomerase
MSQVNYVGATRMVGRTLYNKQLAVTTPVQVYLCPPGTGAKITAGTICNTGGTQIHATLSVLLTADSVDGTHRLFSALPIDPGDTIFLAPYLKDAFLGENESIYVTVDTANVADVYLSGSETSP